MQAAATPLDVLYVSARGGRRDLAVTDQLRVSVATAFDGEAWPAAETIDCLVVDAADDPAVERVRRVRQHDPSTPLVAFIGEGRDDIESVFEAGASDVVRSRPADTPPALVQRRVENVCKPGAGSGQSTQALSTPGGLLAHLGEGLQDVIWVNNPDSDADSDIEFVNQGYEAIWGRPREYLLENGTDALYETIHPEDRAHFREVVREGWQDSGSYEETYRIVRPDGEIRWIHDHALGVFEDGEIRRTIGIARDITEHKEREQQLERQNDLFAKAQDIADVGAWEYDCDGQHRWTEKVYDLFDVPQDRTLTLENARQYYHPDDWPQVEAALDRALEEAEPFDLEVRMLTEHGEQRWGRVRGDPQTEDGAVVRVRGTIQDITGRKERERELKRSRMFLEQIQTVGDIGGWEYDFRTNHLQLTDETCKILDLPSGVEPTVAELLECYHPEDRETVQEAITQVQTEGEPFANEVRVVPEDGEPRWVYSQGEPVYEGDEVVAVRGVSRDITEYKEREQALERQNDLFAKAQDIADIGAWEADLQAEEGWWTEQIYQIYGLSSDYEPEPGDGIERFHPEDRPAIREAYERTIEEGEPYDLELRIIDEEGTHKWVRTRGEPQVEDGEAVRVRGTLQDITERIEREQRLQAERDLVARILETSPVGIHVYDADGHIVHANEQAAATLDVERDSLEGETALPAEIEVRTTTGEPVPTSQTPIERVKRTGEPVRNKEAIIETPAGEEITVVVDAVPLFDDGELHRVVIAFDDVTERVERERQLESQRDELARLDRINQIIRDVDMALVGATSRKEVEQAVCNQLSESGRYRSTLMVRASGDELTVQTVGQGGDSEAVSPRTTDIPPDAPTRRAMETGEMQTIQNLNSADCPWTVCRAVTDGAAESMSAIPVTYGDQTYGTLVVCTDEDTFDERELDVLDELGETVGYAISAVESREREATLTSLYEATQDLLAAECQQEVCDVVVETAASVLGPPGIGIFLFDDEENALKLEAGTDTLHGFYDTSMTFGPGREDSITWQTYVSGEEQFFTDVRESEYVVNSETDARTALFLPLGDHGVFFVGTPERMSFGEQKRRLIGLLAATTEAALDRVAGRAGIRERDRRLAERATRLESLERLLSLVGDVDDVLDRAGTRQEVEQGVCEQLVDTEPYAFAWIGAVPPDGTAVEPRAWADGAATGGRDEAYLDDIPFALDGEEPVARAATTGESVCVQNVTDHLHETDWAQAAVERDYQSVLAMPLVHGDVQYGVLAVYARVPHAFDDISRSTLERLCEAAPRVINGIERDRAVLADRAVELELALPDPDTFLNVVAATVGEPVRYREVTPAPDGGTRVMFTLSDPPLEEIRALVEEFVTVESLDVVERPDGVVCRVTLAGSTAATTVLSCGAIPHEVVAEPDRTTATVRLPREADVRLFLDRVDAHYPGAELRSRRDIEGSTDAEGAAHRALAEDLTDRQREVLRTAYERGFFESPRETTGVELADLLDISQPTVTHHLREAQRRLFDSLFDEPSP